MNKFFNRISIVIVMVLIGVISLSSCKKDGVYKPKKKISKVFYEYKEKIQYTYGDGRVETRVGGNEKYLEQVWQWDGKLLKTITNYSSDGELYGTTTFNYDGKKIATIQCVLSDGDIALITITYEGNKINKLELTYNGQIVDTYTYKYDGKKVSEIEIMSYDYGKKLKKERITSLLQFVMPEKTAENVALRAENRKQNNAKSVEMETVKMEWEGNNVVKETWTYGSEGIIITYTYDKNKNPYYGLIEDGPDTGNMSENNVEQKTISYFPSSGAPAITKYTYTYNNKFPTMKTYTYTYTDSYTSSYDYADSYTYKSTDTYTRWYEYE